MAGVRLGLCLGSSDTYRQLLLVASTWILSTACDHALLPHPCSGSSAGSCKHNKQLSASVSLGEAWVSLQYTCQDQNHQIGLRISKMAGCCPCHLPLRSGSKLAI